MSLISETPLVTFTIRKRREKQQERENPCEIRETMSKKQKIQDDSKPKRGAIDLYAVQCGKCQKWRSIATKEEYEELRCKFMDDPYTCDRQPNVTCDDPADLECDATRTWVIDKPNLPKTPAGFKRELILRSDYSKLDAHYLTPTGKKVRCQGEVVQFLEKHPEYRHLKLDDFNFTVPKILEDTIPPEVRRKRAEKSASKKDNDFDGKRKNCNN